MFDGTVATSISTLTADRTLYLQSQIILAQPIPHSTLREEAKEFSIFMRNSEIAMRAAAGEERKLCWGGYYKFFPEESDGKDMYAT